MKKITFILCIGVIFIFSQNLQAATITWDGSDSSSWTDAANWDLNQVPTNADDVIINDANLPNQPQVDADVSVRSIDFSAGQISVAGANMLSVVSDYTQSGGTFSGGGGTLEVNGDFTVSGGSFTASSGDTFFARQFNISGTGSFDANGGTVIFDGAPVSTLEVLNSIDFNNLILNKPNNFTGINAPNDTVRINGTLTLTDGLLSGAAGKFEALGDIVIADTFNGGTGQLDIIGNAARTVTIPANCEMPNVTINAPNTTIGTSGAGSVEFGNLNLQDAVSMTNGSVDFEFSTYNQSGGVFNVGSGTIKSISTFTQSGGSFTGSASDLDFNSNLTISGGTFAASSGTTTISNSLAVQPTGIFNANGGTIIFDGGSSTNIQITTASGIVELNNVEINKTSNFASFTVFSGGTMRVNGNLILTNGSVNGAFAGVTEVLGNLTIGTDWDGGTGQLAFTGGNVQTYQNNGGVTPSGPWILNKTGGNVNLANDLDLSVGTNVVTLINGTITTGAANKVITGTRTITATNGFINGGLQRTFTSAGSRKFDVGTINGAAPVTVNATAGTFGSSTTFTVRGNAGTLAGSFPAQSLTRNWTLEPSAGGITTADITFEYQQTDVPASANESAFEFLKLDGGMTTNEGISSLNTTNNTATLNGVTTFSDWSLGQLAPTAANASIGGRVLSDRGRGIPRATLKLTDFGGNVRYARTNPFGYYRFENVEAGQSYIISVSSKSYEFPNPSQTVTVFDNLSDINFIALNRTGMDSKVSISGSLRDGKGNALTNTKLQISAGNLKETLEVQTDDSGSFVFENLEINSTYIINVRHKQFVFAPQVLFVSEDIENLQLKPQM